MHLEKARQLCLFHSPLLIPKLFSDIIFSTSDVEKTTSDVVFLISDVNLCYTQAHD